MDSCHDNLGYSYIYLLSGNEHFLGHTCHLSFLLSRNEPLRQLLVFCQYIAYRYLLAQYDAHFAAP